MSYNELVEFIKNLKQVGCKTIKDAYTILYRDENTTLYIQTQIA